MLTPPKMVRKPHVTAVLQDCGNSIQDTAQKWTLTEVPQVLFFYVLAGMKVAGGRWQQTVMHRRLQCCGFGLAAAITVGTSACTGHSLKLINGGRHMVSSSCNTA